MLKCSAAEVAVSFLNHNFFGKARVMCNTCCVDVHSSWQYTLDCNNAGACCELFLQFLATI